MPTKHQSSDTDTDSSSDVEVISGRIDEDRVAVTEEQDGEDALTDSDAAEEAEEEEEDDGYVCLFPSLTGCGQCVVDLHIAWFAILETLVCHHA